LSPAFFFLLLLPDHGSCSSSSAALGVTTSRWHHQPQLAQLCLGVARQLLGGLCCLLLFLPRTKSVTHRSCGRVKASNVPTAGPLLCPRYLTSGRIAASARQAFVPRRTCMDGKSAGYTSMRAHAHSSPHRSDTERLKSSFSMAALISSVSTWARACTISSMPARAYSSALSAFRNSVLVSSSSADSAVAWS